MTPYLAGGLAASLALRIATTTCPVENLKVDPPVSSSRLIAYRRKNIAAGSESLTRQTACDAVTGIESARPGYVQTNFHD